MYTYVPTVSKFEDLGVHHTHKMNGLESLVKSHGRWSHQQFYIPLNLKYFSLCIQALNLEAFLEINGEEERCGEEVLWLKYVSGLIFKIRRMKARSKRIYFVNTFILRNTYSFFTASFFFAISFRLAFSWKFSGAFLPK